MKLDHRRQKVASFSHFSLRLAGYFFLTVILMLLSLLIGILGYHYLGDLGWLDSFYMSCMILTGMGPLGEMPMTTRTAKFFSSFFALYSGIIFLTVAAVFFTPIIHRILHILHVESDEASS